MKQMSIVTLVDALRVNDEKVNMIVRTVHKMNLHSLARISIL